MSEVVEQVSVPAGADALAQGLKKLVLAVIANHKAAAGNVLVELSADVTEAVKDLGPALGAAGLVGGELKSSPIGVAEALALAGFQVARELAAEPKQEVATAVVAPESAPQS